MRVVVYDRETYEPLTVIDVPQHFIREMEAGKRGRTLCFPTYPSIKFEDFHSEPSMKRNQIARLRFEEVYKAAERLMWMCTTDDGETALLLRATFLPGQRGELNRREETAFIKGMFAAMA